jgi:hypothetical protein
MPSKDEDKIRQYFSFFDGIGSSCYILDKASDVDGFLGWLQDYHSIGETGNLLGGYKFLLDSILKCFLYEIYVNHGMELSEDETIFRAHFKGVELRDTPNTCEKTVLIKRIWVHGKSISRAKTWLDVRERIKQMRKDLAVFGQLLTDHCEVTTSFDKEYVIQALACDRIFTFLNDTHHKIPLAELTFPSIKQTATEKYLTDAFPGYVYGLQYLWYSVIGKEQFKQTPAKDLHLALDKEEVKKYPKQKSPVEELLENMLPGMFCEIKIQKSKSSDKMNELRERLKRDRSPRSEVWSALDGFYRPIQEQIVDPRGKILKVNNLGVAHLLVLKGYSKRFLKDLLDPSKISDADYLTKNDPISIKKQLSFRMLWYDPDVLDTESVFNGVPAFASTLLGSVELARAFRNSEPVKVIIFKHPAGENQFDYSFAIFIPAETSFGISDYSGWLVFYDCANDDTGFGGSLLQFAETVLHTAQGIGPISLNEIVVERELFKEYLKERSVSSVFDLVIKEGTGGTMEIGSFSVVLSELDDFLGKAKGKLLEHAVYKWLRESNQFEKTDCDTWIDGEQIDCIAETGNTVSFFECKLNLHKDKINDTINQIKRKFQVLSKNRIRVQSNLVVYEMIPAELKTIFEKNDVVVMDDFKSVIIKQRIFDGVRQETLQVLDWQFQTPNRLRPRY